jgi:hypothetical protein
MHPSAPMRLPAMCEGWRGRSGSGGPNQTKKTNQKPINQTKAHETRPAQCNKRKLSSPKQCNDNSTLYPKTLTAEIQFFQMRKMNQR